MFKFLPTKNLAKQSIALLGLGQENQAFLAWLLKHRFPGKITICDQRNKQSLMANLPANVKAKITQGEKGQQISWQLEELFKNDLGKFNYLFRSPGWPVSCPAIKQAIKEGAKLTSPMNAFFAQISSQQIIGVTGSKGKGTTASLITAILKQAGKQVFLGGNIGIAPFSFIDKITTSDYIVLELSSFQLEDLASSPKISVITNFYKDHLAAADPLNPNYHSSLTKYWQAKLKIARRNNKFLVANLRLKSKLTKEKLDSKIIYFTASQLKSGLVGAYNQENIGAAVATAKILKIKSTDIKKAIKKFKNLNHRLELVAIKREVKYFDNSFATSPDSTLLDLQSFTEPIIQIAGGADKGADFQSLAKIMVKKVKYLILLPGAATKRLKQTVIANHYPLKQIKEVKNMKEAVRSASCQASRGEIVLLSTACASFGIFKNYKDRGDQFKYYVQQIN